MTTETSFIESDERQALRKSVAALAANYGRSTTSSEAGLAATPTNCGARQDNSASSG